MEGWQDGHGASERVRRGLVDEFDYGIVLGVLVYIDLYGAAGVQILLSVAIKQYYAYREYGPEDLLDEGDRLRVVARDDSRLDKVPLGVVACVAR